MKVTCIHAQAPLDYACQVYWVQGMRLDRTERNTLVDAGSQHPDSVLALLRELERHPKGIGKKAVEQVILTHAHYDHTGGISALVQAFQPEVLAWRMAPGVTQTLRDGQWLHLGDEEVRVLHTPGHSDDSICLFAPASGILFSGDTLHRVHDATGAYPRTFLTTLERLLGLDIRVIYSGHDEPRTEGALSFIQHLHQIVQCSVLQDG